MSDVIGGGLAHRLVHFGAQRILWEPELAPYGGRLSGAEVEDLVSVYLRTGDVGAEEHFRNEFADLWEALNGSGA